MQPDYTFAVQYNTADILMRARQIRTRLLQGLAAELSSGGSWCLTYTPDQPQRLLKLMEALTVLADVEATSPATRIRKADILADLVASNLGTLQLSSSSRGPFRMCDARVVQLFKGLVQFSSPAPSPVPPPSPPPPPSPSPATAQPSPPSLSPSPSPPPPSISPSPSPPSE
jgi:hypothetical protein